MFSLDFMECRSESIDMYTNTQISTNIVLFEMLRKWPDSEFFMTSQ